MRFLFVHQNFPGQFRHIADALAADPQHDVAAIADARNIAHGTTVHARISLLRYESPRPAGNQTHGYLRESEAHIRRGQQVYRAASQLKARGYRPDIIVVHPGWGEALFLRELFPEARHIHYCEFFYHGAGCDIGFDPEFCDNVDDRLRVHFRNSTQLIGLTQCDAGIAPTEWQRSRFPAAFRPRIEVLHEGVDTRIVKPDPNAVLERDGQAWRAGDEIVTYVARNLEPYRGFHSFMRALPEIQARRPSARILLAGGDKVSYGRQLPAGATYRSRYTAELGDRVDWSRVHFLGRLPYRDYLKLLQVSAVHVYLTYPFVLSWSMLEAMAAGCLVIGSDTAPVREVIEDGHNGLLTDFFDGGRMAERVAQALADPGAHAPLRTAARTHVQRHFDLRTRSLPAWLSFLTRSSVSA